MLRGIDPIIGPELIHALRAMGHGDEITIVDANFPAVAMAKRLIRMDGHDAVRVADAVLSLMPLDRFAPDETAIRMEVVGDPDAVPPVCALFQDVIDRRDPGYKLQKLGALRLLRAREAVLRDHRHRRTPALRQCHPQDGCDRSVRRVGLRPLSDPGCVFRKAANKRRGRVLSRA